MNALKSVARTQRVNKYMYTCITNTCATNLHVISCIAQSGSIKKDNIPNIVSFVFNISICVAFRRYFANVCL